MKRAREKDATDGHERARKVARMMMMPTDECPDWGALLPDLLRLIGHALAPAIMPVPGMDADMGLVPVDEFQRTHVLEARLLDETPATWDPKARRQQQGEIARLAKIGEGKLRRQLYLLTTMGLVCRQWFNTIDWKLVCTEGIGSHSGIRQGRYEILRLPRRRPYMTQQEALTVACYGLALPAGERTVIKFKIPDISRAPGFRNDIGHMDTFLRRAKEYLESSQSSGALTAHVMTNNLQNRSFGDEPWRLYVLTVPDYVHSIRGQQWTRRDHIARAQLSLTSFATSAVAGSPRLAACAALGLPTNPELQYAIIQKIWSYDKRKWETEIPTDPAVIHATLDRWRANEAYYRESTKLIQRLEKTPVFT
jgi:hypothetical protein